MSQTPATVPCARCGKPFDTSRAGGVCPACAIRGALREETGTTRQLERYRLLEPLGEGGMGAVWLAEDPVLERLVALKVLPVHAGEGSLRARLQREARAMARLDHPHVVKVFEVGETPETVFLAMELAEGGDLRERLREGAWEPAKAVRLLLEAAGAVAHAHQAGLVHRDLKPGNVLLTATGQVRLADFGLAAPLGARGDLTLTGQALGTPAYMAPETAEGRPGDERVDVYGLGALLYELLTGRPPFGGQTTAAILTAVSREEPLPPRLRAPAVDADLETICLQCLQKDPRHRYASVSALEADLEAWLDGRPIAARPISPWSRAWRWAKRHPGIATSLGGVAAALLALAVVSSLAAWQIGVERDRAEAEELAARRLLAESLLEQARNSRLTRRPGQRVASLSALSAIPTAETGTPSQAVVDEAVAALALPDLRELRSWNLGAERPRRVSFDPSLRFYVLEEEGRPGLTLRRVSDGEVLAELALPGPLEGRPLFSPAGNQLVTRTTDRVLRVWTVPELKRLLEVPERPYPGGSGDLFGEDIAFAPDGQSLGMSYPGGGYIVHGLPEGEVQLHWNDPRLPQAAAFSPDSRWLALGHFDSFAERGTVLVLDASTGETRRALTGFGSGQGLAWRPGSDNLAIAGSNRVDVRTREGGWQLRRFEIADGPAHAMWWSPDGLRVWAWSDRGRFRAWDLISGQRIFEWYERIPAGTRFAVSRDGRRLASAGDQWRGVLWEWSPSPVRRTLRPPMSGTVFQVVPAPGTLEFSPDERQLLIAGLNRVAVVELETGRTLLDLERGEESEWTTARWGANNREIWWSREGSGLWRVSAAGAGEAPWKAPSEELIDPMPGFLVSDRDPRTGRLGLAAYWEGRFRLFSPSSPGEARTWEAPGAFEMVFSPDGESVLTTRLDDRPNAGPTIAWQTVAGEAAFAVPDHAPGGTVRWAGKANRVVVVTGAASVDLWQPGAPEPLAGLPVSFAHSMGTYAISEDGRWVAAWTGETLALLDGRTGELFARLAEPAEVHGEIRELRFSPSGRQLAAVRRNGTVSLWDLDVLFAELRRAGLVSDRQGR